MEKEILSKIQHVSDVIKNSTQSKTDGWRAKIDQLTGKPLPIRNKSISSISNEIDSIIEVLQGGNLFDALKMGAYYQRFVDLASSKTEGKDDVKEIQEVAGILKYALRQIVEMMDKEKLFDGFSEDVDIFNKKCDGSTNIFASYFFDRPLDMFVEYARKPWSRNKVAVGLYGRMSAGKTSVLNALFDEKFPVCTGENTAVPTYLYYGNECNYISLVDAQDSIQKIDVSEISIIDWDKSYHFPFHRMYDYIAKQNDSEVLLNFTFVDAPGVFSGTSSNHIAADKSIEKIDIIVWVTDLKDSLGDEEKQYLAKHANGRPVYIVTTFTELMTDEQYQNGKQVIIDRIEEIDINLKGILRYNKNCPETFKENFNNIVITGTIADGEITPTAPEDTLMFGIKYLQKILEANLSHYTEARVTAANKQEEIENAIRNQGNTFSNRINDVLASHNHLCDEYNTSILLSAMLAPINRLTGDLNRMISSYNNMDIVNLAMDLCLYRIKEAEAEQMQVKIQDLQHKLEVIIDKIS